MKTFTIILTLLCSIGIVQASPYELCDPNPTASYYVITGQPPCLGDGGNITAIEDGSLRLDVNCVEKGTTWFTDVKACNVFNDCSISVPFVLSRPNNPTPITWIKLVSKNGIPTMISSPNSTAIGQRYIVTGFPPCIGPGPFFAESDGSISVNVSCIAKGTTWNITLKVCTLWGDCSSTFPFVLIRPGVVSAPVGLKVLQ